jgi:hypothetical protein
MILLREFLVISVRAKRQIKEAQSCSIRFYLQSQHYGILVRQSSSDCSINFFCPYSECQKRLVRPSGFINFSVCASLLGSGISWHYRQNIGVCHRSILVYQGRSRGRCVTGGVSYILRRSGFCNTIYYCIAQTGVSARIQIAFSMTVFDGKKPNFQGQSK